MNAMLPPPGTRVKAKRASWQDEDREEEYASDDLEGTLEWRDVPAQDGVPAFTVCLVGGQEADPATVEEV